MSQVLKPKKGYKSIKWLFGKELEIPEGWDVIKLGDLFNVGSSKRVLESQWQSEGVPFYRGREITSMSNYGKVENKLFISENLYEEYSSKYGVPKVGDILITAIGTIGNSYIVKQHERFYFKDASVLWLNRTSDVNSKFINYWFKSERFFQQLDKGNGSTVDSLTIKKLQSIFSLIPTLIEQQKIASILSNIDELIISTQKIIDQTKSLKQGLMQKLLTKGIDHKKFKKVKWLFGKELEIPKEWEIRKTDDIFEFLISGTNARSDLIENGEILYIHYGDIHTKWNLVLNCDLDKIPRINKEKVSRLPLLKDGDLVIVDASGDVEGSGTSISLKNVKNKKIVAGLHTLVLRSKDENISFDFMRYLTSISYVKIQITSWVTGAKVFGLTKKSCKEIKVPIPSLREQQKIAEILSNTDSQIQLQTQYKKKLERLKKSLMQKLLTGEVRVKV